MSLISTERTLKQHVMDLFADADVQIGGNRPWDIQVYNEHFFSRVGCEGSLGLGESYMDGWWGCQQLDEFFTHVLQAHLDRTVHSIGEYWGMLCAKVVNLQSKRRAFMVGKEHYDIGNTLYRAMLDRRMIYSCGYWKDAKTLDEAQEAKLDLVCRKLQLKPGMRVLDIGCGWGGAAAYAAAQYGVEVVGVTISAQQVELGKVLCKDLPVELRLQDYRDLHEPFDRIYSLGMFEHVGRKNYDIFFQVARRCLKKGGLFLLHTIGNNTPHSTCDPWLARYIFPNSMIPSPTMICEASTPLFTIEDWHNFGADYDPTLMHWLANFNAAWPKLKQEYDERFYRKWTYYLQCCAGSFRARDNHLWQIVFSPKGVPGGYRSIR